MVKLQICAYCIEIFKSVLIMPGFNFIYAVLVEKKENKGLG